MNFEITDYYSIAYINNTAIISTEHGTIYAYDPNKKASNADCIKLCLTITKSGKLCCYVK